MQEMRQVKARSEERQKAGNAEGRQGKARSVAWQGSRLAILSKTEPEFPNHS